MANTINEAIIRELFDAWNTHDVDRATALIDESCNVGGREGFRRELAAMFVAFPDVQVTVEDMLSDGDKVATRATIRGTQQGVLSGIQPTGKPVVMKANHIFHLKDGRITQRHGQADKLEVAMQLGMKLVPAT